MKNGQTLLHMKTLLRFFIITVMGTGAVQAQNLSPTVVASAGGYASGGNYTISWTLGEVAISTLTGGDFILTQGFQQPWELDIGNAVEDISFGWSVIPYPNPVDGQLRLRFNTERTMDYNIEITDLTGKKLSVETLKQVVPGQEIEVDFSGFAQGLYLMTVSSDDREYIRTVRIQKY